jgi:hypothetical protein
MAGGVNFSYSSNFQVQQPSIFKDNTKKAWLAKNIQKLKLTWMYVPFL